MTIRYKENLKSTFWNYYMKRKDIIRSSRNYGEGNIDIVTVETYQNQIQINGFIFCVNNYDRATEMLVNNLKYVHRSWLVVPEESVSGLLERYGEFFEKNRYCGLAGVQESGRYTMHIAPRCHMSLPTSQELFNLLLDRA